MEKYTESQLHFEIKELTITRALTQYSLKIAKNKNETTK
jgi:hypothetical protein